MGEARDSFGVWRQASRDYMKRNSELAAYRWKVGPSPHRSAMASRGRRSRTSLCGCLLVSRTARRSRRAAVPGDVRSSVSAAEQLSGFQGRVVTDPSATPRCEGSDGVLTKVWRRCCVTSWPRVGAGVVSVNEDLIEDFPRTRMPVAVDSSGQGT